MRPPRRIDSTCVNRPQRAQGPMLPRRRQRGGVRRRALTPGLRRARPEDPLLVTSSSWCRSRTPPRPPARSPPRERARPLPRAPVGARSAACARRAQHRRDTLPSADDGSTPRLERAQPVGQRLSGAATTTSRCRAAWRRASARAARGRCLASSCARKGEEADGSSWRSWRRVEERNAVPRSPRGGANITSLALWRPRELIGGEDPRARATAFARRGTRRDPAALHPSGVAGGANVTSCVVGRGRGESRRA
jgi:hypothetical protein